MAFPKQQPRFPMTFGAPSPFAIEQALSPNFDTSATPFSFGGADYFPQQEPVPEDFMPQWGDPGFGAGPDLSGIDPGFAGGGNYPNPDPGFGIGGPQQRQRPMLIPELEQNDVLPQGQVDPGFLQYMQQQGGPMGDIGIKAAILARSFTNPEEALQWAVKLKESQAQRQFQMMQAQQQQEATRQNIKLRNQASQEQKKQTQLQSRILKLDASIRQAKIDPDQMLGTLGPPNEENIDQWEREIQREVARVGQEKKTQDNKNKVLGLALKGPTEAPQYTDPKSKTYDPVFARQLKGFNDVREQKQSSDQLRDGSLQKLADLRTELMKERIRVEKGALSDTDKKELEAKYKELDLLYKLASQASEQASTVDLFAGNREDGTPVWEAAQEKYNYQSGVANQRLQDLQEKIFEIKDYIGAPRGKGVIPPPSRTLPGGVTAPAPTQAPAGGAQPSEKAVQNYLLYLKSGQYSKEALDRSWAKKYPGVPPPTE